MQDVSMSPVGRALGLSADIRTRDSVSDGYDTGCPANYVSCQSPTSIRTNAATWP
jgi:hypothetical protein